MLETQSVIRGRTDRPFVWSATAVWVLALVSIFALVFRRWAMLMQNPFGPFLLVVLFGAAAVISWQWNNLLGLDEGERARSARQYFALVGLIALLVAEFGLVLHHV